MKNILVLMSVEERHRKRLEAAGESCRFIYSSPEEASWSCSSWNPPARMHTSYRVS